MRSLFLTYLRHKIKVGQKSWANKCLTHFVIHGLHTIKRKFHSAKVIFALCEFQRRKWIKKKCAVYFLGRMATFGSLIFISFLYLLWLYGQRKTTLSLDLTYTCIFFQFMYRYVLLNVLSNQISVLRFLCHFSSNLFQTWLVYR